MTTMFPPSGGLFRIRFGFGNRVLGRVAFISAVEGGFRVVFGVVTVAGFAAASAFVASDVGA